MHISSTYITVNILIFAVLIIGGFLVIRMVQNKKIEGDESRKTVHDVFRRRMAKKGNTITGNKTSVMAIVSGVSRNLRTQGGKETFYIICSYKDPDTKKATTFTSKELTKYPGKDIIGKVVRVQVDPEDENNYTVDLSSLK